MSDYDTRQSSRTLLSDALSHVSNLVRGEVDLARAEITENIHSAGAAIGLIAGALVILLTALNVLAAALVAALAEAGLAGGWSALIVGGVLAIIAIILARKGIADLKVTSLAPTRTARNVKRDADMVRETAQNEH